MKKPSVNRGWYGDDKVEMASDDKAAASAADYDAVGVNNDGEGEGDSKERSSFDEKEPAKGLAGEVMISSSAKQTLDVWDDEISEVVLLRRERAKMDRDDTLKKMVMESIGRLPKRPKTVNACVSKMREIGFSESIVSLTEEDFKYRKPGTWTKEDLFAFACHLAEEEDAKVTSAHRDEAPVAQDPAPSVKESGDNDAVDINQGDVDPKIDVSSVLYKWRVPYSAIRQLIIQCHPSHFYFIFCR